MSQTAPGRVGTSTVGRGVLPGFRLTLGFTLFYFGLIVLIPLAALVLKGTAMTGEQFWRAVSDARALASYRLTFGAALAAAGINAISEQSSPGCWCATTSR